MNSVKISLTSVRVSSVLPSLIDRLGDSKDQVRDQDQALLLKIMDQAANPQVQHTHVSRVSERRSIAVWSFQLWTLCFQFVWERMMGGFKHKNNRTREGLCLCLISTLNVWVNSSCVWTLESVVSSCFFRASCCVLFLSGLDLRVWRSVRSFLTSVTSSETPRVRYSPITPPAGHTWELHLTTWTRVSFCYITKASPAARLTIPHSRHTFQTRGLLVPPLSLSSDRLQRSVITGTTLPVEDRKPGPWTALPEAEHLSSSASRTVIMSAGSIFMSVCQLETN